MNDQVFCKDVSCKITSLPSYTSYANKSKKSSGVSDLIKFNSVTSASVEENGNGGEMLTATYQQGGAPAPKISESSERSDEYAVPEYENNEVL